MDFYQSIAKYYHHIFPLNKVQIEFIKNSHHSSPNQLSLLDIGCAIGDLSLELANNYKSVSGIDLDKGMINTAIEKAKDKKNLEFLYENMLNITEVFGESTFNVIACFGNTLVHLNSEEMVGVFFEKAKDALKPNGKLLIQIINYDRIIDQDIRSLPTIENDTIKFERNYEYLKEQNKVNFETILSIKESQDQIKNCIPLLAIRKSSIEILLQNAGFTNIQFFGNFKRDQLNENSMPLIIEAKA